MTTKLASEHGKACYAKRKKTIEPVFGQLKEQQGARRFLHRGLAACEAEWKLLCGTHNPAQAVATPGQATIGQPDGRLSRDPGESAATAPSAIHPGGHGARGAPQPGRLLTTRSRRLWATASLRSTS
jgi:hypothetical protein